MVCHDEFLLEYYRDTFMVEPPNFAGYAQFNKIMVASGSDANFVILNGTLTTGKQLSMEHIFRILIEL